MFIISEQQFSGKLTIFFSFVPCNIETFSSDTVHVESILKIQWLSPFLSCDEKILHMWGCVVLQSVHCWRSNIYFNLHHHIPYFGNYFQTELTSCERICPILKIISSTTETTNTCVTFTKDLLPSSFIFKSICFRDDVGNWDVD